MSLLILLAGALIGSLAVLGAIELVHAIRRRIHRRRLARQLDAIKTQTYRERRERGVSRSVWEGGDDAA